MNGVRDVLGFRVFKPIDTLHLFTSSLSPCFAVDSFIATVLFACGYSGRLLVNESHCPASAVDVVISVIDSRH